MAYKTEVDWRVVPLGFVTTMVIGALLLVLPWAQQPNHTVSFLDSLFTAVSATCVTGLTTVNVAENFNTFGQIVVLFLIQIGGLGIMTASILFLVLSRRRLSLNHEEAIHATFGRLRQVKPVTVFSYACLFVLLIELGGALLMSFLLMNGDVEISWHQALWEATFHSVSAFCNAGISIYAEGIAHWRAQLDLLAVMDLLVIAGGIGFLTLVNLRYWYFWRRDRRQRGQLTLQSKIAIFMTCLLILLGTLGTLILEGNRNLATGSRVEKVSWALLHSVMSRTAGFSVVDIGQMQPTTLQGTIILMFIGGAPGSMAGGIKTVTMALLVLTAWTSLQRREDMNLFNRRIPSHLSGVAIMIALLASACLLLAISLLMISENGQPASLSRHGWLAIAFEAVSAFGTVGLSTGITPLLTPWGKLIIIALMFIGRVGPLVLAVHLSRPVGPWHVRYPKEPVALG